jgi:hypothetical protein
MDKSPPGENGQGQGKQAPSISRLFAGDDRYWPLAFSKMIEMEKALRLRSRREENSGVDGVRANCSRRRRPATKKFNHGFR